jgi:adenylate cyclase
MVNEIETKYVLRENGVEYISTSFTRYCSSVDDLAREVESKGEAINQGYLPLDIGEEIASEIGIRIDFQPTETRLRNRAGLCYFTLKGEGDMIRNEVEKEIDTDLLNQYWGYTIGRRVEKFRLNKPYNNQVLEIDLYTNRDLLVVEVEFPTLQQAMSFTALGLDVTANKAYKNKNLAR